MESLGGFVDPSPRPSTPSTAPTASSSFGSTTSLSNSTPTKSDTAPTSSSTSTATEETTTTLDLDKEVQNVIAGFGSFWGKFRKQSTAAFSTAEKQFESTRKDLNPLLSKAKANLDNFSTAARAEVQRLSEVQQPSANGGGVVIGADGLPMIIGGEEDERKLDKGKGVDRISSESTENPAAAASAFFSKIQSQLTSMQDQAPQARHALSSNFSQFQDQLSHLNLKNSTAEEYLHRGEHWFSEFKEEVSKLAKEAVQIVPPSLSGQDQSAPSRKSEEFALIKGMTRKDTLLYRLRSDPSVFLVDPSLPPLPSSNDLTDHRSAYSTFLSTLPSSLLDSDLVKDAREQGAEVLEQTREEVTKEGGISEEEFWKRYLFRVHLIEQEEEKRKKVLSVAQFEEEDFSWDIDDEETNASLKDPSSPSLVQSSTSQSASQSLVSSPTPDPITSQPDHAQTKVPLDLESSEEEERDPIEEVQSIATPTTNQSPRTSSEGTRTSFDIIGESSGNQSGDEREGIMVERKANEVEKKNDSQQQEEDEDSDWE